MRYLKWIALLRVYFLKFLPINLHGQAALAITVANNMNATHSDHNYFAMHRRRNAETPSTTALWSHDQAVDHQSWNMVFLKVFQEDLTSKQTAKSIIPWPVKAAKDQWKPLMWQYDCSVKQIIAGSNVPPPPPPPPKKKKKKKKNLEDRSVKPEFTTCNYWSSSLFVMSENTV